MSGIAVASTAPDESSAEARTSARILRGSIDLNNGMSPTNSQSSNASLSIESKTASPLLLRKAKAADILRKMASKDSMDSFGSHDSKQSLNSNSNSSSDDLGSSASFGSSLDSNARPGSSSRRKVNAKEYLALHKDMLAPQSPRVFKEATMGLSPRGSIRSSLSHGADKRADTAELHETELHKIKILAAQMQKQIEALAEQNRHLSSELQELKAAKKSASLSSNPPQLGIISAAGSSITVHRKSLDNSDLPSSPKSPSSPKHQLSNLQAEYLNGPRSSESSADGSHRRPSDTLKPRGILKSRTESMASSINAIQSTESFDDATSPSTLSGVALPITVNTTSEKKKLKWYKSIISDVKIFKKSE
ncbi:hypothetical protein BDR26DRAFT_1003497 [Obelidium mucronatum]|nr:hypothetical protein BDR26DRAFT_1003497 [Obelidium mucronatum]